jgi:glutaredoxin
MSDKITNKSPWSKELQDKIDETKHLGEMLKKRAKAISDSIEPEYRLVVVDGFDLTLRQIIIKYDKKEPMPMVSIGDTMLVVWKPDKEEV